MESILAINSSPAVQDFIRNSIQDSYLLLYVQDTPTLEVLSRRTNTDLVILDTTSIADGARMCRRLRQMPNFVEKPLLVLADVKAAQDVAQLLDAGADDCVRKPLVQRELAARIRALLRRTSSHPSNRLTLTLYPREKRVLFCGRSIDLTRTEFELLETLCQHPGEHFTTAALLQRVWKYPPGTGDPALVRNHVRNLRRKLEDDPERPRVIMCFQGRGYTVSAEIQNQAVSQLS